LPPQARQALFWQVVKGAVQPTSPEQQGSPAWPHAPPMQPPATQVPRLFEQAPLAATQVPPLPFRLLSQQPPPAQALPAQHGWPLPPQASHICESGLQAVPAAVQKRGVPLPPQHGWPEPPQLMPPAPPPQLDVTPPVEQVPSVPPQVAPDITHAPETQQPDIEQLELSQQGAPEAPHATTLPLAQTMPLVGLWPEAKQVPLTQQPPPGQVLLAQQALPAAPHTTQLEPVHIPPVEQAAPLATHTFAPESQQPPWQALPGQHGSPGPPQARHTLPSQTSESPHVSFEQHGWPAPPHAAQLPFTQVTDGAVHC